MTKALWDDGPVAASVCCSTCERCHSALQRCVQILVIRTDHRVTLCLPCWCSLAYQIGRIDGESRRKQ